MAAAQPRLPPTARADHPLPRARRERACSRSAAGPATCSRRSRPSRGVGVDVSPRDGRAARVAASRSCASSAAPGKSSSSARRSTTSSSPTSCRTSHDLRRAVRAGAAHSHRGHAGRDQLLQPTLAAGDPTRRSSAPEAAQADPQLGRAGRRPQPARPAGLRGRLRTRADPAAETGPAALDALPTASSASIWPFTHLCLTLLDRRTAEPAGSSEPVVTVVCPCRNEAGHISPTRRARAGAGNGDRAHLRRGRLDRRHARARSSGRSSAHPEPDIRAARRSRAAARATPSVPASPPRSTTC